MFDHFDVRHILSLTNNLIKNEVVFVILYVLKQFFVSNTLIISNTIYFIRYKI